MKFREILESIKSGVRYQQFSIQSLADRKGRMKHSVIRNAIMKNGNRKRTVIASYADRNKASEKIQKLQQKKIK